MGYSPGGRKELDTIEQLGMHTLFNYPADLEHYSVFVILSPLGISVLIFLLIFSSSQFLSSLIPFTH